MTGSIQEKKGRKYYYAVLNTYNAEGKRKLKWINTGIPVKGNNKRKANEKLKELLVDNSRYNIDPTKDVYFNDYMLHWLEMLKISISPNTYESYRHILQLHIAPFFRGKKLSEMTSFVLEQYISEKLKVVSPNTVRKHLVNISKCLDTALRQNIIMYNPVKRIELPKKVKFDGAKYYNEKQIEQLIEIAKGDPLEIVIRLTIFYGLRRSEVLGLKWDAVDFENRTIAIKHTVVQVGSGIYRSDNTKNESSRAVFPIPNRILSELAALKAESGNNDYICAHKNGDPILPNYVSKHFAALLKRHNMPHIRFHDLRHSSATYLKYLGFDLKDIQIWLRHKDIGTTMNIYTHLDMDAKSNIANSLDARLDFSPTT